jgi:hypothetical protein
MKDNRGSQHRLVYSIEIPDIGLLKLNIIPEGSKICEISCTEVIDHANAISVPKKALGKVGSNEPGSACDLDEF